MQETSTPYNNPIFQHNASIMLIVDPVSGKIIDANNSALKFYGYTRDEITSMKIYDINVKSKKEVKEEMDKAVAMVKNYFAFRHRLADGTIKDVDVYSGKIEFEGKILLSSVIHDVSEKLEYQTKLHDSEVMYKDLFNFMEEGFIKTNREGSIISANTSAAKICGYNNVDEFIGTRMSDLYESPGDRKYFLKEIKDKKILKNHDFKLRRKDGSLLWTMVSIKAVEDKNGNFLGTEGLFRDVDEKISAKLALKKRVKELTTFYDISNILEDHDKSLEDILMEIVSILPSSMQYPDICSARLSYKKRVFKSSKYHEPAIQLQKDLFVFDKIEGELSISYGKEGVANINYDFLEEEKSLLESVVERVGKIIERFQTAQALELSEKRLKLALKGSNDAPWDWDLLSNEYFYSPAWWRQIGYKPRELPVNEELFWRFVHEDDKDMLKAAFEEAISNNKENLEVEFRVMHKNKKYITILSRAQITYNENGEAIRITGTNMDLTNRNKSLRESEEKFKLISSIASDYSYAYSIDKEGNTKIEWVFGAFQRITGYKPFSSVNQDDFVKLIHPDDMPLIMKRVEQLLKGETVVSEVRIITKSNKIKWISDKAFPQWDKIENRVSHVISTATDITERKNAELQLKSNKESLEELNATKDKLFSVIGHDLKSPINNIISLAKLANNKPQDYTNEKILEFNKLILQSAESASSLLEDLLTWSQSQSKIVDVRTIKIDLHTIAEEILHFNSQIALQKKISLKNMIPKGSFLNADYEMIVTIFRNLISNALKYTNENGEVSVHYKKSKTQDIISIKDNGIGMSEKQLEGLFKVGENISVPGTSGEKGTGLGLLICKDFIEKNNGEITVESSEGEGTTFHLKFRKSQAKSYQKV